jgi:GT2 family glycosyltransferase
MQSKGKSGSTFRENKRMKLAVIIPTVGRAECVCSTLGWLARQTRRPDKVIVIGARTEDIEGVVDACDLDVQAELWHIGSSAQRNRGLALIAGQADIVLFLDDDFIPQHNYIAELERIFEAHTDIVGVTGRLIDDGVHGTGISFERAQEILARDVPPSPPTLLHRKGLYGCNMALRADAIANVRFDERLVLYGWQEDIDFSYQIGSRGRLVHYSGIGGVHMGIKRGRTSGLRFGYSQIANPCYLLGKGTIPRNRAYKIMWRNVASNLARSIRPEGHVDRRGRLWGNMLALRDLALGRLRPERILELGG